MTELFLYDDAKAREFAPFALTRPVSELRAGAEIIRARWERVAGTRARAFIGARHLSSFDEDGAPEALTDETELPAGSIVVNSRCVVALDSSLDSSAVAFTCGDRVCAVRLSQPLRVKDFRDGALGLDALASGQSAVEVDGRWLDEVWSLVGDLAVQLNDDIGALVRSLDVQSPSGSTISGNHGVYCEAGVKVDPFVVFDATDGPILIRSGATVAPFARIVGPTYIGKQSIVAGDEIRGCSIGDVCKVRGEISGSVMLGHSNKSHTGFVGSSYLGRWVNLGAGTTTSNLKNTYGQIQLWTPSGNRDTELQFLGSLMGDHVKTGIGTMLTTGCVVGAGANIYGSRVTPKYIPPFAWGECEPYERFAVEKFTEVAEKVMARRHVALSEKARTQLVNSHASSEASA
ncbi:MAG TPA: putative sugar nucleotidyl transferase [Gemmatimonadaceae bacterium]|nr:putative sugar nucleotidyl transferase [Gemmatimonadaceae bacterium]